MKRDRREKGGEGIEGGAVPGRSATVAVSVTTLPSSRAARASRAEKSLATVSAKEYCRQQSKADKGGRLGRMDVASRPWGRTGERAVVRARDSGKKHRLFTRWRLDSRGCVD
jgi:hypothetical protein